MKTAYQERMRNLLEQDSDYVPLESLSPNGGPLAAVKRPKYHGDNCFCADCADTRASMEIFEARKAAADINDWWNS